MITCSLRATARSLKEQQLSAQSLHPGAVFGTVYSPFYISFLPQETVLLIQGQAMLKGKIAADVEKAFFKKPWGMLWKVLQTLPEIIEQMLFCGSQYNTQPKNCRSSYSSVLRAGASLLGLRYSSVCHE